MVKLDDSAEQSNPDTLIFTTVAYFPILLIYLVYYIVYGFVL